MHVDLDQYRIKAVPAFVSIRKPGASTGNWSSEKLSRFEEVWSRLNYLQKGNTLI